MDGFLFPFCYRNDVKNSPTIFSREFLMRFFLKFKFINDLCDISMSCGFDLKADIAVVYFMFCRIMDL